MRWELRKACEKLGIPYGILSTSVSRVSIRAYQESPSERESGGLGGLPPSSVAERWGIVRGEENLKKQFLIEYFACKIFTRAVLPKGKSRPIALIKGVRLVAYAGSTLPLIKNAFINGNLYQFEK